MNHRKLEIVVGLSAVALCAAAVTNDATAGYLATKAPPRIEFNTDRSGSLSGSIGGVRGTSDPVGFIECYAGPSRGGCTARGQQPPSAEFVDATCHTTDPSHLLAIRSISSVARVVAYFDRMGNCTRIVVSNGSEEFPHHLEGDAIVTTPPPPPPTPREMAHEAFDRDVYPILRMQCAGCHGSWGDPDAMFDLFYDETVESQSPACDGERLVLRGNPGGSVLVKRLEGTSCGNRMPIGGTLGTTQINGIKNWILSL